VFNRDRLVRIVAATAFVASITSTARAQDEQRLTGPENHVLDAAVTGGPDADFSKVLDRKARTIHSSVIEKLLTGVYFTQGRYKGRKLNPLGFTIRYAIFDGPLTLGSIDVPVTVHLNDCEFKESATFSSAHFSAPLYLSGSMFHDVSLNSTRVDDLLDLTAITVKGKAQFYHLSVKGDLFASRSTFAGAAEFGQAHVQGKMFFGSTCMQCASSFGDSLSLRDIKALELDLENVRIRNTLVLSHADVKRVLNLKVACFDQTQPSCLPEVQLEGLTYGDLYPGARDQLRTLIDNSKDYSARSYTQLEEYYRTHGDPEQADNIFLDMRAKERDLLWRHWMDRRWDLRRSAPWLWSWILRALVGYGRYPENALYYSFAFLIIGTWIFWKREDVTPRRDDDTLQTYDPLWYSFDLLTPFIDLHLADYWMPRQGWRFGRIYAHFHRIVGWVLVPIGIAAITGIIK
jgi:hypothetical protein